MTNENTADMVPVAGKERIEALDVVRGFALIGICLMNIDFFNRSVTGIGAGIPSGLSGINWLATVFNQYFIVGKFWTIFSLLFGMGFAVMLKRSEEKQHSFLPLYIRRITALAIFGTLHHIFLWPGDILFSYAVAAVALLIVLYGTWKGILATILAMVAIGFIPGCRFVMESAGPVAFCGLAALYLRNERLVKGLPVMSMIMLVAGIGCLIGDVVCWLVPNAAGGRIPLAILGTVFTLYGLLSAKYHQPQSQRAWRLGAGIYVFGFTMAISFTAADYFKLFEWAAPKAKVEQVAKADAKAGVGKADTKAVASKAASEKETRAAEREKRVKERMADMQAEVQAVTHGSYWQATMWRAKHFATHAQHEAGFATILIGMFLLGSAFVRSGVMENTAAHLPLFRKLAFVAWPFGVGLGLLGALISTGQALGAPENGWNLAATILQMGNLFACLGYVGLVVLALHGGAVLSKIRVLAPLGRMALTNYLTHSVVMSLFFYGYGLGHFGMERAAQFGFVAIMIAIQVVVSTWWLARFRYGPMEWVWRAITYWHIPPMRLATTESMGRMQQAGNVA